MPNGETARKQQALSGPLLTEEHWRNTNLPTGKESQAAGAAARLGHFRLTKSLGSALQEFFESARSYLCAVSFCPIAINYHHLGGFTENLIILFERWMYLSVGGKSKAHLKSNQH